MATINDSMGIARTPGFQDRIRFAALGIARNVLAEDGTTTGHSSRIAYAKQVFSGNFDLLDFTIVVLNESAIIAVSDVTQTLNAGFGISDNLLPTTIFGLWNAFSGVTN